MMAYCPMCNRVRPVEVQVVEPFIIQTCMECGHVHSIRASRTEASA